MGTVTLRKILLTVVFAGGGIFLPGLSAEIDPATVVIVANANQERSMELAGYYAEKRGIPEENIIALPMSDKETLPGTEFVAQIWDPLQKELLDRDWISGSLRDGRDDYTRQNAIVLGHSIGALVLCKGVPLRVAHEDMFFTEEDAKRIPKPFHTTRASVDSELALLAAGGRNLAGPVNNPLYQRKDPPGFALDKVIRITRLDGPSFSDAKNLVDSALIAEEKGLRGRSYVDLGGPHKTGDQWLEEVIGLLEGTHYDLDIDRGKPVLPATARFDAPAIYFGWYTRSISGAWEALDVVPPPGAIAFHIHSFSASTLRKHNAGWSGPLVARGVAVTVGNVYEPYLEGTHNPVLFLESLLSGHALAEAALYSNRFFSWQTIVLGDPLYRPFSLSLEDQLQQIAGMDSYAQYAVIREMNRVAAEEGPESAAQYGQRQFARTPGMALALKTARLFRENGQSDEALRILLPFAHVDVFALDEIAIVLGIAAVYDQIGDTESAFRLLRACANQPNLPRSLREKVLEQAQSTANRAGKYVQADEFRRERDALRTKD